MGLIWSLVDGVGVDTFSLGTILILSVGDGELFGDMVIEAETEAVGVDAIGEMDEVGVGEMSSDLIFFCLPKR